jgi:hypothetical protein
MNGHMSHSQKKNSTCGELWFVARAYPRKSVCVSRNIWQEMSTICSNQHSRAFGHMNEDKQYQGHTLHRPPPRGCNIPAHHVIAEPPGTFNRIEVLEGD